ncbi:MAG: type II toxin-antitoxin system RelE/ParE family toxin [Acidobacteria bacterium]|nr:type II toxin-antitoxin system RelE/ParE family toxin [Acidobacteriota bacterium]MBI3656537.1 type II toxin-antitoxin system RelE/ParE family toxin [Acidobacteriota bacterium]
MKSIELYQTESGRIPFNEWYDPLDKKARAKIRAYIDRLTLGAAQKNIKPVGGGVYELKIDYGPGYRVYFGEHGKHVIVLLLGGDKSTQGRDIKKAIEYWEDYETNH